MRPRLVRQNLEERVVIRCASSRAAPAFVLDFFDLNATVFNLAAIKAVVGEKAGSAHGAELE